jgi:sugar lactone lactonase YvrE
MALDAGGNLYYFLEDGTLERYSPNGSITSVATIPSPGGVAVNAAGNIFVASNYRIYELNASGAMQLIAGCACYGDGGPVTGATVSSPTGLARDAADNLYFSDLANNTVRRVALDGTITRVAGTGAPGFSGDGGPALAAQLLSPSGLAIDSAGNLYIADRGIAASARSVPAASFRRSPERVSRVSAAMEDLPPPPPWRCRMVSPSIRPVTSTSPTRSITGFAK